MKIATKVSFYFAFLFCLIQINTSATGLIPKDSTINAVRALIRRIVPSHADQFNVVLINKINGKDAFGLKSENGKIILEGSNGISIASALNYYLKNFGHCNISWNGNNLKLPKVLPLVPSEIIKTTSYDRRWYLNYCTFNYTMSWWGWKRWQWEIDFMALNGINTPLAVTGQDIIWKRVYKSFGFTDKELDGFFSGPAYLNWFWMGNLDGWDGPIPQSWMESHEALQKKILKRERELGMTPVLPAFTGHVPPSFNRKFPNVKVKSTQWVNFPAVNVLDPSEPMFLEIGKKFMEEQTKAYGTDHLYSADTFNENVPPTNDSVYLNNMSKKVYASMSTTDPDAVWVMQAWMFSHNADFWKPTQVKAILNAIPNDKMIVLDVFSESFPVWNKTEAFYGKQWIWNMLQNFGGNIGLFGRMDAVVNGPSKLLNNPKAGNLVGIGVMPEGLEQNPVMYELMLDNIWENKLVDLKVWLDDYASRRYGRPNEDASQAWQILRKTVYSGGLTSGTPKGMVSARPTFDKATRQVRPQKAYKDEDFIQAWDKMVKAAPVLKNSDGFQYDLVDISRQVLSNYGDVLQQRLAADYQAHDLAAFTKHGREFLNLITDMDLLLATRSDFLLGKWLNSAKVWGKTPAEASLFEKNARNLITDWGDTTCRLNDYAARQWSGMMNGFHRPRWELFISQVTTAMQHNQSFNSAGFEGGVKKWEWNWINSHEVYTDRTKGDAVQVSVEMYKKYRKVINQHMGK